MRKPVIVLVALSGLLLGCSADSDSSASDGAAGTGATTEQACAQAQAVTTTYTDGLGDAASPEDARAVITDAVSGLRDIQAEQPVDGRIDAVATALADLLAAVEAGEQPQALRPRAEEIGRATSALTEACGTAAEPG